MRARSASSARCRSLHIEILYNEDNFVGAFTLAALLALAAITLTLIRSALERKNVWTR